MIKIIMCTYNGEKFIKEQLESIADSSVKNWELYISDDGSSDSTMRQAELFRRHYPNKVHVQTHQARQGAPMNFLTTAYQIGQTMAEEDFIMFCDQDDVWYNNKIEITLNQMEKLIEESTNEIPLLVCSDAAVVNENLKPIAESFRKMNHYSIKKLDLPHLMMENKIQGCTLMMNKTLAMCLEQLPRKIIMHDGWVGLIAAAMGRIAYIDSPTMKYRQHSGNAMGSVSFWKDVLSKFGKLKEQRLIVFEAAEQTAEFVRIFHERMPEKHLKEAKTFATLPEQSYIERKMNLVRYRMWKSGILRNVGLTLLL